MARRGTGPHPTGTPERIETRRALLPGHRSHRDQEVSPTALSHGIFGSNCAFVVIFHHLLTGYVYFSAKSIHIIADMYKKYTYCIFAARFNCRCFVSACVLKRDDFWGRRRLPLRIPHKTACVKEKTRNLFSLHSTNFIRRDFVHALRIKCLRCIRTHRYLNPAASQHEKLDEEAAALHCFDLIFFRAEGP